MKYNGIKREIDSQPIKDTGHGYQSNIKVSWPTINQHNTDPITIISLSTEKRCCSYVTKYKVNGIKVKNKYKNEMLKGTDRIQPVFSD